MRSFKIWTSMIELVVFDIAGTTVEDPDGVGSCLKAALKAYGSTYEDAAVNAIMGIPKPIAIRELLKQFHTNGQEPEAADVQTIFLDFQGKMIEYYRSNPDIREVSGATRVFRTLRANNVKVALDTGFDRSIVDVLMGRLGWGPDVIDTTVTSDEVAQGRPHPDLVYLAMERTGVTDVSRVAKVGDTPSDLQEGTAAGCALVVGVTKGTHTADQLAPFPHTHLIDTIEQLPDLLAQFK